MQELLFGDALAQRDFSDPSVEGPRRNAAAKWLDLQTLIRDVEGRELDNSEVAWVLRLALRKQEGAVLWPGWSVARWPAGLVPGQSSPLRCLVFRNGICSLT
ncbi:Uncharacterized protein SCF082_LOCUS37672 [Durusdinium trenchii]|uniref:Uncharacterized protein n=1 Tax=Durusdinium trenchii TaxID=1381693 RepID=A0ABP0PSA8_9DINO